MHCSGQARAGVTDAGSARIAHVGHPLALLQARQDRLRTFLFVVLMHCKQLRAIFFDAVAAQQTLGVAGVFAGNAIDKLQHVQGAQADIGQIADGCGHHIQGALRIMLGRCDLAGSAQGRSERGVQWGSFGKRRWLPPQL